jgi:hypothetical protein
VQVEVTRSGDRLDVTISTGGAASTLSRTLTAAKS